MLSIHKADKWLLDSDRHTLFTATLTPLSELCSSSSRSQTSNVSQEDEKKEVFVYRNGVLPGRNWYSDDLQLPKIN